MSLPERPSLEYLKKLAKDRLPALRRANPVARLADAQLMVAREHGFASWRALRARLTGWPPRPSWPAETIQTLFDAIKRGDEDTARAMLAADSRLANAGDADGSTALLHAAEWNQPAMVAAPRARRRRAAPLCSLRAYAALVGPDHGRPRRRPRPGPRRRRARSLLRGGPGRGGARPRLLRCRRPAPPRRLRIALGRRPSSSSARPAQTTYRGADGRDG